MIVNQYIKELDIPLDYEYLKQLSLNKQENLIPGHRDNHRLVSANKYLSKIREKIPYLSPIYNVNHMPANNLFPIHIDGDRPCALNIPIENTENSFTTFYEIRDNMEMVYDDYRILHAIKTPLEEKFRFTLIRPTIIDTSVPHGVIHTGTGERLIISWGFMKNVDFKKVCELFSDDVVSGVTL
jgi:hypothetical protein